VFEIEKKNELKLKEICKRYHKKYIILSESGFINVLKRLRYYIGFILAMAMSVIFLSVFNMYIYGVNIKVEGGLSVDVNALKEVLNDNNIVRGMRKSNVDILGIQNLIMSSSDKIAGCMVEQIGGNLNIVIYPGILRDEVSKENIYSKYNAVITSVKVYAGKSNVKAGDVIKVGDLLIENNNGAKAEIRAKVYFSDYLIYNENQIVKVETGRVVDDIDVLLFNKTLYKTPKNTNFTNYFEENCVFCVSKNLFIPISLMKTKYIEFEYQERVVSFDSKENELKSELYLNILKQVQDKNSITGVTYSVVHENNLTRLDCFVECEIDIV
jgi:similar to stage IV sporulation protein